MQAYGNVDPSQRFANLLRVNTRLYHSETLWRKTLCYPLSFCLALVRLSKREPVEKTVRNTLVRKKTRQSGTELWGNAACFSACQMAVLLMSNNPVPAEAELIKSKQTKKKSGSLRYTVTANV